MRVLQLVGMDDLTGGVKSTYIVIAYEASLSEISIHHPSNSFDNVVLSTMHVILSTTIFSLSSTDFSRPACDSVDNGLS